MDELEVNTLDSEEGLFDDYVPDETTDGTTEEPIEESVETTDETVTEPVANPFELKIKFNGEERTLSEDEARTLAQKGMNYDRFYEPLERLARMNNMSVGDYVNQLNDTQVQYEVSKEMDSLREDPKYADLDEEVLEEIATNRVTKNIGERDREYADHNRQIADEEQARVQRDIEHFFEEYPEYRDKGPDSLDPKVYEFVQQGYTLLEAYNKFQRMNVQKSQAEAKARVSKLNEDNKKKSLGNTSNAGKVETDDFLSGFLNS